MVRIGNLLPKRKHGLSNHARYCALVSHVISSNIARRSVGAPVVDIDLLQDVDSQGPFDVVVQKLTDELVASESDPIVRKKIDAWEVGCFSAPAVLRLILC